MGGILFKDKCRRYTRHEYIQTIPKVYEALATAIGIGPDQEYPFAAIPAYSSKESYGDMDIVLNSNQIVNSDWCTRLEQMGYERRSNSNVHSFAFGDLQVDIICANSEEYGCSLLYFAYNDLGNLLGRMLHKLGIKYGHSGLSLVVRGKADDHIIEEVFLETSYYRVKQAICDILELDIKKWNAGFHTLDDIFQFVASSKYFDPDIYLLHNRNATSRVRDKKRATYSEFLKWCEQNKQTKKHHFENKKEHGGYSVREPYYSEIVKPRWPKQTAYIEQLLAAYDHNCMFATHFNAKLVTQIGGATFQDLGKVMKVSKQFVSSNEFKAIWLNGYQINPDLANTVLQNIIKISYNIAQVELKNDNPESN